MTMTRRRAIKLVSEYVAHYGPSRYGPRGWPAQVRQLGPNEVQSRMRAILADLRERSTTPAPEALGTLRDAVAVLDFEAAHSLGEIQGINSQYGQVFRTAEYVSGAPGAAYHRLITVEGHLKDARRLGAGLRSLVARYERRGAMRRRVAGMFRSS